MRFAIIALCCKLLCCLTIVAAAQQTTPVSHFIPKDTKLYGNVAYAADTSRHHLLDVYVPANAAKSAPLLIWIHGGAWMVNDKYADMGYMQSTIREILANGIAIASIDYRYSTDAVFPAQLDDCKQAIRFLHDNASRFSVDASQVALIGFSAGGHLASLLALSANQDQQPAPYKIAGVLDFYGPSDFIALATNPDTSINNSRNPVSILLGAMAVDRPDLAKAASPVTYVDKNDPPFLIVQGEKDESVPNTQSRLLSSWLTLSGVRNEMVMVPGAPHYGEMFDAPWIRAKVIAFLQLYLKKKGS